MHLGHVDQPGGLRRAWAGLRRRLYRSRPGTRREEVQSSQYLRARGNQTADDVGYTGNAHLECLINDAFYLTRAVAEIERNVIKQGNRNVVSRRLHAKTDKEKIAAWRLDLDKILQVFDVRSIT